MSKEKEELSEARYVHYEQTLVRKVQHFYLSAPIDEPIYYIDMIHRIQSAGADDIVYIHLNTPGGHLDTGVQIVNAIQSTQAHVIVSLEAEAHSLGTLIFLAADEFVVHDNCMMMFHNFSGAVVGKGHEQQALLQGTIKWFTTLAKRLYIPFLTDAEFDRILRGEDLYFHSDEIRKRLERMVKAQQEALEGKTKPRAKKALGAKKKVETRKGRKPKIAVDRPTKPV
jgi:ATP-dependent protease ClpP protease subunit